MRPRLPWEIQEILNPDIVWYIGQFLTKDDTPRQQEQSPSLEKELRKIQISNLKGKSQMYMKDLEDFLLDWFS